MIKYFTFLFFLLSAISSYSKDSLPLNKHPYHVGSVEFNYNTTSKTFEISGTFFVDDLENALQDTYGKAVQFHNAAYKAEINALLKDYSATNLSLKVDNKHLKMNYLGFEEDSEAVHFYLESEKINTPKKVETSTSFLYHLFKDQIIIVHLLVAGKRQSEKLSNPERYVRKLF